MASKFQLDMLLKFGQNGTICLDSTHGTTGYDYQLTSIVVVDEFGNGLPTAFCLSSKSSAIEWTTFFKAIKDSISTTLSARVLMTDNDPAFYNAWVEVMGPVEHRLLCSWHVDQAWRRNVPKKVIYENIK